MIKKFSKILILTLCVCLSLFAFAGCNNALKGGPSANDVVYGNGGIAVVKGDYIYYVNGYTNYSDVTSKSKNTNVKKSALYRTKLNNGKLDYTYNELDTEQKYSNTLSLTEVVAPKVVGHENTALYIYDNNIYYSSPNTDKDREGNVKNEYLDFYVSNLNGTGNKHIYKTNASSSNQKYAFTKIENTVYLLCYDGTNLVIVNTSTKAVKTISNAVTSAEFSVKSTYASARNISRIDFIYPYEQNKVECPVEETRYYRFYTGDGAVRRTGAKVEYIDQHGNWVEDRALFSMFVGGDSDYYEISREEAEYLAENRKRKK